MAARIAYSIVAIVFMAAVFVLWVAAVAVAVIMLGKDALP